MRIRRRRWWAAVILALAVPGGDALGSCGSYSCPADSFSREPASRKWLRLGYEFEYIDQNQARILGRSASAGEIRGHHDERYTINRVHRLAVSAGITRRLGAELQLPFISRSHGHVHHHRGADIGDSWSLSGLGDLTARLRYSIFLDEENGLGDWSVLGGGRFPTGRRQVENAAGAPAELGITPGTGSYDLILGGAWFKSLQDQFLARGHDWPVYGSASWRVNGPGEDGYRFGDLFQANLGTSYPISHKWSALLGLDFLVKRRDWKGSTREETQKTGGEFLYVSPGALWRITRGWEASVQVQAPVYQRVNQIQIVSRINVITSLSYRFDF